MKPNSTCITKHFAATDFDSKVREVQEQMQIADDLRKQGVPFLTAMVMAGDIQSARAADEMVKNGMPAIKAYRFIGSYARFDWCVKNLPRKTLMRMLPELWVAADPYDTKPEYLQLWKQAFIENDRHTVCDGMRLPKGKLTIYRGQIGDTIGISWTLDKKIAAKFAATGGGRQAVVGGKILQTTIDSRQALAYLTGRGESEVIIDIGGIKL